MLLVSAFRLTCLDSRGGDMTPCSAISISMVLSAIS
jgi:hypothetical protein